MTNSPRSKPAKSHPHGWYRVGDIPDASRTRSRFRRRVVWGGIPWTLVGLVVALTFTALERVRGHNRVLELGAEVTALTREHAELLELKRRLQAERAYLRHPDRIEEVARTELGFTPIDPGNVKAITIRENHP